MNRKTTWIITGIMGLALLVFLAVNVSRRGTRAGAEEAEEGEESAVVEAHVTPVMRGAFVQTLSVVGTVQALPNQRARVSAQIGGRAAAGHRER